jgi:hypothetical protein
VNCDWIMLGEGIEELFWIVIVVGSLIAQIAKSRRQARQKRSGADRRAAPPAPPPAGTAATELRRFLQEFQEEAAPSAPRTPAPPPVPVASRTRPASPAHARPRQPRATAVQPVQVRTMSRPTPPTSPATRKPTARLARKPSPPPRKQQKTAVTSVHAAAYKQKDRGPSANQREQRAIMAMLRSSRSAQKAILLREILGRPLALRKHTASGGWEG